MEIINIEKKAFETMMARFDNLAAAIQKLCNRNCEKGMNKWYDNQDVCMILKISPRTLQTLRDNGTLPYCQLGRKMYYKPDDVQNAITTVEHLIKSGKTKSVITT